jgi:hypothetical protein
MWRAAGRLIAMPHPMPEPDARHLLVFNQQLLAQTLTLVAAHEGPGRPAYAGPVGSHLRHVIEHWEALVLAHETGCVDYDARLRDALLAACPARARRRLHALQQTLQTWDAATLSAPVRVRGLCGLAGELPFAVDSSVGRELAFVASHAVHHFALLAPHCLASGIPIDADFGKAPGTVAHERELAVAAVSARPETPTDKENACTRQPNFA